MFMGEQRRGLTGYRLWHARPFCLAALGLCVGIVLSLYVPADPFVCLAGCFVLLLCMLWLAHTGRRGFFVLLVLAMAGVGWARMAPALRGVSSPWPEQGHIQGTVREIQQNGAVYTLLLDDVWLDGRPAGRSLRVRTKSETLQNARPGDVLSGPAFSIWEAQCDTELDRVQRYANHWDKLAWIGENDAVLSLRGVCLAYAPARLRQSVARRLDTLFGAQAGVVKGMLLGDKSGLTDDETENFQKAGVSHILAVSGLHISFVAALAALLLARSRLGRRTRCALLLGCLWGYCAMVGFPASAVRATVMASVRQMMTAAGHRTDGLESLSIAALALLLCDPLQLFTPGFQLSFAAVWGIDTLTAALTKHTKGQSWLAGSLATSLGAQVGLWPVSLRFFGQVSLVSLLANLFVVPLAAMITAAGFVALACFAVWPALALGFAKVVSGVVLLLTTLTGWTARLPGALVAPPPWPVSSTLLFLASLFFLSPHCLWNARDRWVVVLLCWTVALALALL